LRSETSTLANPFVFSFSCSSSTAFMRGSTVPPLSTAGRRVSLLVLLTSGGAVFDSLPLKSASNKEEADLFFGFSSSSSSSNRSFREDLGLVLLDFSCSSCSSSSSPKSDFSLAVRVGVTAGAASLLPGASVFLGGGSFPLLGGAGEPFFSYRTDAPP